MLMGHPPPITARGREKAPQGYFEGLTPVQVPVVVAAFVACNTQGQETLADPLEVVQAMTQAGPYAFHRVAVYTETVRVTTSVRACAMVACPMVIVSLSEMVDVVCIGEERRPGFSPGRP
jgi:hypothetical protein